MHNETVPTTISVSRLSKKAKIKWKAVSAVRGYELWSSTSKNGYKLLLTTKKVSYTKAGLTKGKTYYFKVRTYIMENDVKVYSKFTKVTSIKI